MNKKSSNKFDILCPHFRKCSGCSIDLAVNNPPILPELQEWFENKGVKDFVLRCEKANSWRLRAKLAVRGSSEAPHIGLYEEGSHRVVDIPNCRVHHPTINEAVEQIKTFISQRHISIYNEETRKGDLRYLQFVVERSSGRVQVSFVLNFSSLDTASISRWRKDLEYLWKSEGVQWHSFSVNLNTRQDNVIFSPIWDLWHGDLLLWESFFGVDVCFQASSFAQANLDQFEVLLQRVYEWVPENLRVAEYYAGVGVIGLILAAKSGRVLCCEINPQAQLCFDMARKRLSEENAIKISWFQGPSESFSEWLGESDVIIVDPPRKGLGVKFINDLKKVLSESLLVYISCGWPSFKRDSEALLSSGWQLERAEGHLFFPGTNHIETLALFRKDK